MYIIYFLFLLSFLPSVLDILPFEHHHKDMTSYSLYISNYNQIVVFFLKEDDVLNFHTINAISPWKIIATNTIDSIFDVIKLKIILYNKPKTMPHNNQFQLVIVLFFHLLQFLFLPLFFTPP